MKASGILLGVSGTWALSLLFACTSKPTEADSLPPSTEPHAQSPAKTSSPSQSGSFMPDCLNITEGDVQVEYNKDRLILTNRGKTRELLLDEGAPVRCEKLRIVEGARKATVEIIFMTRPTGTSIQIADRKLGLASISEGKWAVNPFILDRIIQDQEGLSTDPYTNTQWSEEGGEPILTRTDLETKKTETFRP